MKELFEDKESNVRSYCRKYDTIFTKSKDEFLFDYNNKKYIDFFSGAGSLNYGHNNEIIKSKVIEYIQNDGITHGLDFYTGAKHEFIDQFYSIVLNPRGLNYKVMFTGPTGTNAIEAALKLSRKVKKRPNVVAFSGAFHGMSLGSLALTTDMASRKGAGVNLHNVTFLPFESGGGYEFDSLNYLEHLLNDDHSGFEKPSAVFFETTQAEGGVYVATVDWLKRLDNLCKSHDILLVCDDIQVGCGRTGTFFSFESAGIQPDMVVLSKSISGYGFPMSILLFKPELDIWKPGEHNGTFRGNQIAFVSAASALKYWTNQELEKGIQDKAQIIENFLNNIIVPINSHIQIRGKGLIWAIDFERTKLKDLSEVVKLCFKKGLVIETCGRKDSALKLLPPLLIEDGVLLEGLNIIKNVLNEYKLKCLL